MVTKSVIFNCEDGMQMKSTAILIQKASNFKSTMYLARGDRRANAKSLLGVMSLGIEDGMEITVTAEGPDEEDALQTICEYLLHPEF